MPTTLLVEPHPSGHRFQAVAHLLPPASRSSDVVLLTSRGARDDPAYAEYLGDQDVEVHEVFDSIEPSTAELVAEVDRWQARGEVDRVVLMDADQALKRWFWAARRLRKPRPRVIAMLTRYPARLTWTDRTGVLLRVSKASLVLMARLSGTLHHAAGFAGRDDLSRGWVVRRARDPETSSARTHDRAQLRAWHDLPEGRRIIGIFGVVTARKHPHLVWQALEDADVEADLLLGGALSPDMAEWAAGVTSSPRRRLILHDRYLTNRDLDELVAACDAVALIMTNNGPSGIQGKALAAGVPVVTAGSLVRAREARLTGGGVSSDLDAESIAAAIVQVLDGPGATATGSVPSATAEEFAAAVLGEPATADDGSSR